MNDIQKYRGLLGHAGRAVPVVEAPVVTSKTIVDLIHLSLAGLARMYDPEKQVLFTRDFSGGDLRDDRLSLRYTVMSSVGIFNAIEAGYDTDLDPQQLLVNGFEKFAGDDLDHLGMALWSSATIGGGLEEKILKKLLPMASDEKVLMGSIGRVVAWVLTGICRYVEKNPDDEEARKVATRIYNFAKEKCWSVTGELFFHHAGNAPQNPRFALFSTQIYWVYALAVYGKVFKDPQALEIGGKVADSILRLRDPFGGFAWRYDALLGKVTERYPVYSVHQDAMAPMAFFALDEATGRDSVEDIRQSLGWLWRNQLDLNMVDLERVVIFRAIRRKAFFASIFNWIGRQLTSSSLSPGEMPGFLRINPTSRPYHLGWLLHAFCGREGLFQAEL
jgi:hypothetical protein